MNLHAAVLAIHVVAFGVNAAAADVNAAFALALKGAMEEVVPGFERTTGHKVRIVFEPPAGVAKRIADGERIDVVALPREALDALAAKSVLSATPAELVRGRMGVGIKAGSSRPDVSSPQAMRSALLAARAIVHSDPTRGGAGATNSIAMFNELGIAAEMKAKTVYPREHSPQGIAREVTDGNADLALNQVHEIVESGLELAGPFPGTLERTVTFSVAPMGAGGQAEAVRAFIDFLRGPEGTRIFKAHGLAPADL
jgi:molybdate transport system substrate-binding protein